MDNEFVIFLNMINKINKEIKATPTGPSKKNKQQGAQKDPEQEQDRVQVRARTG
jgi:hypothetical protein